MLFLPGLPFQRRPVWRFCPWTREHTESTIAAFTDTIPINYTLFTDLPPFNQMLFIMVIWHTCPPSFQGTVCWNGWQGVTICHKCQRRKVPTLLYFPETLLNFFFHYSCFSFLLLFEPPSYYPSVCPFKQGTIECRFFVVVNMLAICAGNPGSGPGPSMNSKS